MNLPTLGKFIVLEGADGSGKSTAAKHLLAQFQQAGLPVIATHEMGGTPVGAALRALSFGTHPNEVIDPVSRLMMAITSRIQNLRTIIEPALASGTNVICDRWSDSTWVYQGQEDKLRFAIQDLENIEELRFAAKKPDHLLFFDVSPEVAIARAQSRAATDNTHYKNNPARTARIIEHYREHVSALYTAPVLERINADKSSKDVRAQLEAFVGRFAAQSAL